MLYHSKYHMAYHSIYWLIYYSEYHILLWFTMVNTFHLYADDTQLYIKFEMTEINRLLSLRGIEQCINDVRAWMGDNKLNVNDDKTVALVLIILLSIYHLF